MGKNDSGPPPEALQYMPRPHAFPTPRTDFGTVNSVCVVGNSSCVLGSGLGETIDRHDVVIRMNLFRIDGFEGDVGSRCDICVLVQNQPALDAAAENRLPRQVKTCKEVWFSRPPFIRGDLEFTTLILCQAIGKQLGECYFPDYQMFTRLHKEIGCPFYPSTGITTILMALMRFPGAKISIAGIDHNPQHGHYYDSEFQYINDFDKESELVEALISEGLVERL